VRDLKNGSAVAIFYGSTASRAPDSSQALGFQVLLDMQYKGVIHRAHVLLEPGDQAFAHELAPDA
jgi:hypothetical protein